MKPTLSPGDAFTLAGKLSVNPLKRELDIVVPSGYYTFEHIFVVDARTRLLSKPHRFQIFSGSADGTMAPVPSVPPGTPVTHLNIPVRFR